MANLLPPPAQIAGNHITFYEGFFQVADVRKTGNIGAADAASFLKKSGLSDIILSKIWDLCDPEAKGYLDKRGFFMSLKLIALVQNGHEATLGNLAMTVPPPKLGDIVPTLHNVTGDWRITTTDKVRSDQIFETLQPINNKVSGDKVKPVLLNSNLPVDILSNIWDLSDIDKDGHLDRDEFAVAMHLIYRALDKDPVPAVLPNDLIPPSKRRRHQSGTSSLLPGGVNLSTTVHALSAGPTNSIPQASLNASLVPPTVLQPSSLNVSSIAGSTWVVPAADKAKYDLRFVGIDTNCDGLVNGLEVKDIFMQSGLHQSILAQIWSLCDTHGVGSLNSDQFALAMHFIEQKMTRNVDPPQALSADMITSSMRNPEVMRLFHITPTGGQAISSEFAKEMEAIEKEIEGLKREKIALEADKQQKEADIRIRNGEVQTLQKELDAIAATNQQLERQKSEAQKRLDELDDKKAKCQEIVRDLKERTDEKQRGLSSLKDRYAQQEKQLKEQEMEAARLRAELSLLSEEQRLLEQQLESSRQQMEDRRRMQETDIVPQINAAKAQVESLLKEQAECDQLLKQYTALMNGDPDAKEPIADAAVLPAAAARLAAGQLPAPGWPAASARAASPAVPGGSTWTSARGLSASPVQRAAMAQDPFGNGAAFGGFMEDMHQGDPFKHAAMADPFKEDPFKTDVLLKDPFQGDDPFKNDPFIKGVANDPFSSSSKKLGELPIGVDPFSSGTDTAFGSRPGSSLSSTGPRDAFDPFSDSSTVTKNVGSADPFASDPFSATAAAYTSEMPPAFPLSSDSLSKTTTKKAGSVAPPRPAPPAPAHKKAERVFGLPSAADPFGSADPFASAGAGSSEPFASSLHSASSDPFAIGSTAAAGSASHDPFGGSQGKSSVKDSFTANFADFNWDISSSSWPASAAKGEDALGASKSDQKPLFGSQLPARTVRSSDNAVGTTPLSPSRIETDI